MDVVMKPRALSLFIIRLACFSCKGHADLMMVENERELFSTILLR